MCGRTAPQPLLASISVSDLSELQWPAAPIPAAPGIGAGVGAFGELPQAGYHDVDASRRADVLQLSGPSAAPS